MMDYAGRVAQADTYPKMLRLNAREHGNEIALREKISGSGVRSPGMITTRGCATSRSVSSNWAWAAATSSASSATTGPTGSRLKSPPTRSAD